MPKLVRCVDTKNYNLTLNNEYEVEVDPNNRERYLLRNDRNIASRYGTNLFEDVPEEPVEVRNDIAGMLASLNVNAQSFSYERIQGERINQQVGNFGRSQSHISCGIQMMSNISDMYTIINRLLRRDAELTAEEVNALTNRIYSQKLQNHFDDSRFGAIIASTNTNATLFEEMNEVMETFNVSTSRMYNPNSGNEIITYVFNLEKGNNPDADVIETEQEETDVW